MSKMSPPFYKRLTSYRLASYAMLLLCDILIPSLFPHFNIIIVFSMFCNSQNWNVTMEDIVCSSIDFDIMDPGPILYIASQYSLFESVNECASP